MLGEIQLKTSGWGVGVLGVVDLGWCSGEGVLGNATLLLADPYQILSGR